MDNPYITSELTEEIKHMRRRYRIRMWITLGVLMITIWLVLQLFNIQLTYHTQLLNRDEVNNHQIIERIQQSQSYRIKADFNKVNKLNDIADI